MIDAKLFIKALNEFEKEKGIAKETVLQALKEAMEKGFTKQLGQTDGMDEARVRVDIDPKKATIRMVQIKKVVASDDDIQDDFMEIALEETQNPELNPNGLVYQVGDDFEIEVPSDELTKLTAQNIKSVLKQKLSEAEKAAIYEAFKDKKGEIISGIVEKVDERSTFINFGRTSVYLPDKQKIKGETFKPGDAISVYVTEINSTTKGAQISISRTDPGFLKRLFEREIHEIFEGTVVIKDIAREAGDRSKVAVYTTDPAVDPIGACIGQGGARIQSICNNLGNVKEKEKIDVVQYFENPALYIAESLKPANVIGVAILSNEEGNKKAVAVVENEQLSLAIGKKGVNARLAVALTHWNIDIKETDQALKEGINFKTIEQIKAEAARAERVSNYQEYVEPEATFEVEDEEDVLPVVDGADFFENDEVEKDVEENSTVETPVVEENKTVHVKTNISLDFLEKGLEEEKKRQENKANYLNRKRNFKKGNDEDKEEEDEVKPVVDKSTYMNIYTQEELDQMEAEEEEEVSKYDEDIDYDEFDSYYDED